MATDGVLCCSIHVAVAVVAVDAVDVDGNVVHVALDDDVVDVVVDVVDVVVDVVDAVVDVDDVVDVVDVAGLLCSSPMALADTNELKAPAAL